MPGNEGKKEESMENMIGIHHLDQTREETSKIISREKCDWRGSWGGVSAGNKLRFSGVR